MHYTCAAKFLITLYAQLSWWQAEHGIEAISQWMIGSPLAAQECDIELTKSGSSPNTVIVLCQYCIVFNSPIIQYFEFSPLY